MTTPSDGMSGYRKGDGTWTGITGNLNRGEIDIGELSWYLTYLCSFMFWFCVPYHVFLPKIINLQ